MPRIVEHRMTSKEFLEVLLAGLKATGRAEPDVHTMDLRIDFSATNNHFPVFVDYEQIDFDRSRRKAGPRGAEPTSNTGDWVPREVTFDEFTANFDPALVQEAKEEAQRCRDETTNVLRGTLGCDGCGGAQIHRVSQAQPAIFRCRDCNHVGRAGFAGSRLNQPARDPVISWENCQVPGCLLYAPPGVLRCETHQAMADEAVGFAILKDVEPSPLEAVTSADRTRRGRAWEGLSPTGTPAGGICCQDANGDLCGFHDPTNYCARCWRQFGDRMVRVEVGDMSTTPSWHGPRYTHALGAGVCREIEIAGD